MSNYKTILNAVLVLSCSLLLMGCDSKTKRNKEVHVFCDRFPQIMIDSVQTDTAGLRKFVRDGLTSAKTDSMKFIIECPEDISFDALKGTEMIISTEIMLAKKAGTKVMVYNKCMNDLNTHMRELKLGSVKEETKPLQVVINVDARGGLLMEGKSIDVDSICKKYEGRKVRIELITDKALTVGALIETMKKFQAEGFMVLLKMQEGE